MNSSNAPRGKTQRKKGRAREGERGEKKKGREEEKRVHILNRKLEKSATAVDNGKIRANSTVELNC